MKKATAKMREHPLVQKGRLVHSAMGWQADPRSRFASRQFRAGQGAGPAQAGRHDRHDLRLLFDRLQPENSPQGWAGYQSNPHHELSGQSRDGLPERLGGTHSAPLARSRHHALPAQRRWSP